MKTITKKIIGTIMIGAVTAMVTVGATSAYLKKETVVIHNVITPGGIAVDLNETAWKEELGKNIYPGQVIEKNPQAANTGKNESWMFLKVSIPMKNIRIVDPISKKAQTSGETELFSFSVSDKWTLISKKKEDGQMKYVYGYTEIVRPGEQTECLFDSITMAHYLEGEINGNENLSIPVTAFAIQENVGKKESLKEIYEQFLDKEGGK